MARLKGCLFMLFFIIGAFSDRAFAQGKNAETGLWDRFEIALKNNRHYNNPFIEVDLVAEFVAPDGRTLETWGFYDGSETWKLRFMPDQTGEWRYSAWFSDQPERKVSGTFWCSTSDIPGLISADETNPVWFGFKGGKHIFIRSFHVGDRFFASNWSSEDRAQFLDWAAKNKYNTLSIASHYLNRAVKNRGQGWDTPNLWDADKRRPNPAAYAAMEAILDNLADRKMIVFPFGGFFGQRSGYPKEKEAQQTYIKYTLARIGAYWNVLFNVSGPEPMLKRLNEFTKAQIDAWGETVASMNVSGHLLTVHNVPDQNPFIHANWAGYQCLQGPKTINADSLYHGLIALRNPEQPLYAQETLWYGNIYHKELIGREYTDDDLCRNAWIIAMAGAALNFADNDGDSSSGFSGTLNLEERHQDKHDIVSEVWDFFEHIPFYELSPSPDLVNNGYCLAKAGEAYLVYLPYGGNVRVKISPGYYRGEWIKGSDTKTRVPVALNHIQEIQSPSDAGWVLYLRRENM